MQSRQWIQIRNNFLTDSSLLIFPQQNFAELVDKLPKVVFDNTITEVLNPQGNPSWLSDLYCPQDAWPM
jgi:hypothetical protein